MAKFALQSRLFWLFVLVGHAVGAAAWVALMPHGFPIGHPRFFANIVVPIATSPPSSRWPRRGRPALLIAAEDAKDAKDQKSEGSHRWSTDRHR